MREPAFTPVGWFAQRERDGDFTVWAREPFTHLLATVVDDDETIPTNVAANARLIAAAPDLYALSERAMRWFADNQCAGDLAWEIGAALAKARGGA